MLGNAQKGIILTSEPAGKNTKPDQGYAWTPNKNNTIFCYGTTSRNKTGKPVFNPQYPSMGTNYSNKESEINAHLTITTIKIKGKLTRFVGTYLDKAIKGKNPDDATEIITKRYTLDRQWAVKAIINHNPKRNQYKIMWEQKGSEPTLMGIHKTHEMRRKNTRIPQSERNTRRERRFRNIKEKKPDLINNNKTRNMHTETNTHQVVGRAKQTPDAIHYAWRVLGTALKKCTTRRHTSHTILYVYLTIVFITTYSSHTKHTTTACLPKKCSALAQTQQLHCCLEPATRRQLAI